MKQLIIALFFLMNFNVNSQVTIHTEAFDNGMNYPVIKQTKDKDAELKMNQRVHEVVDSLKAAEFCIGDFGYVLRGPYLQIHIFHNCDYQWDQTHVYLNFWIHTGEAFDHSEMFIEEKKEELNKEIFARLVQHKSSSCHGFTEGDDLLSNATVVFHKNAIEFKVKEKDGCNEATATLAWTDLKSFMKEVH